jgi:hypothetical protein
VLVLLAVVDLGLDLEPWEESRGRRGGRGFGVLGGRSREP